MTAFQIKLLAIITMAIDHVGLFLFPQLTFLRMIGRLAFPLFAWLIANGAYHTHNIKAYLTRLLLFGLFSQIPFLLTNQQQDPFFWELNVLFTLSFGLIAIIAIKATSNKLLWFLATLLCAGGAALLKTDYGAVGVLSIIVFYLTFKNLKLMVALEVLLFTLPYILPALREPPGFRFAAIGIEPLAPLALVFIALYNEKEGIKAKYLFYVFYPVQYAVIYLIKVFI